MSLEEPGGSCDEAETGAGIGGYSFLSDRLGGHLNAPPPGSIYELMGGGAGGSGKAASKKKPTGHRVSERL